MPASVEAAGWTISRRIARCFRFKIALLTVILLAAAFSITPGCKKKAPVSEQRVREVIVPPQGKKLKLAFVTNNASDFWKKAEAGVKRFHDETGIQVDFKQPSSATVTEQNNILNDLLTQGYDGIAISVISPEEQAREINKATDQTNIIAVDSDCPNSNRLQYIGTDNYQAGKALGERIVKLMPNGGKMAVFVGTFSADNARQRRDGIKDAVASHGIEITVEKEDNKDPTKARSNAQDVINNTSLGVKLLCGLWSYNGGQIASAIEASNNKGKIIEVCFDDDDDTLAAIERGTISCTVVQKPFQFGYESSKLLYELATKGKSALPAAEKTDLGVEVIDADNVKAYRERLASMVKK